MAQNQPAIINESALASEDLFSDARVQMIRDQIARDAPAHIFAAMIDIAKRRKLDPLARQISLIKFGGQYTIITTIDGYRALAEQTGQYAGSDAPVFTYSGETTEAGKKAPDTATVTVYKLINGHPYPFSATVYFEEYSTGRNNWSTMPRTMLAKVAESHALRKAFPAVMSGLYEESEMDQAIEGTARVVESRPTPIQQPRERRPEPVNQATPKTRVSPPPVSAMRRIHGVLDDYGLKHLHLNAWAIKEKGVKSSNELTVDDLQELENNLADDPAQWTTKLREMAGEPVEQRTEHVVEAEYQEVDPDTGEVIPAHVGRGGQGTLIDLPDTQARPGYGDA